MLGKFHRVLEGGLAILIPILDQITYVKVLKEVAVAVESQSAITADNVTLRLDGVLYYKILDPYKASYGIENAEYAITQLAQTAMRAEIGMMTLDKTLAERAVLNSRIVSAMNQASQEWGIQCLRYEVYLSEHTHSFNSFIFPLDKRYNPTRQCGRSHASASLCREKEESRNLRV